MTASSTTTSLLFSPLSLRDVTFPNRLWMAPMCQYSAPDDGPDVGAPTDWHVQHYGSRAVAGPGMVIVEATAVAPAGRITPWDLGIWSDTQVPAHRRVTAFLREQGVVPGIQIAHAGRKASTDKEFLGGRPLVEDEGGWTTVGPSAVPFADGHPAPRALTADEIRDVVAQFAEAARRAIAAGYQVIEVHAAHGYLLHQFLSPESNRRTDGYGGDFAGRTRLTREVARAVRGAVPDGVPVLARVSATDWVEPEGWTADETVRLAAGLREDGVDMMHVSTGGNRPAASIPVGPGYQVPFAARVRAESGMPTVAVGMLADPHVAEQVLADGSADAVAVGRQILVDPVLPRRTARALGVPAPQPPQYARAERR
ncbi:NADH:flavin oxidoreductase/NADH oxidase [Cellulomonas sp. IC4_254]|uniref:NADH:flavin oxidoreductase/NADH oxidase n=1 Tax=Cellulomonas sp. IC4_254 TaxID=2714040 RepID=UPI00141E03F5|nr:NADH:flavin oxidoreductase/NADH oxidase [Cellulomonas sp. IC4_254]NHT16117.1 NADH:flavin oxidoreductase/NADH oxidase [Cellulomonas sp. IC4_254]